MSTPSILTNLNKGDAYKKAISMGADAVIKELQASELRGRGGAGFPTGLKWKFTREAAGDKKFVVCNADEGELGTFKDRKLLLEHAHKMFEGMAIAAYVLGAKDAYLYLRWEYHFMQADIEKAMAEMHVLCPEVDFHLSFGGGAYVCGEESALIESIEGKRGEPRNKPPYPVTSGLFECPTIINNVETFCCVPHILLEGAAVFASVGTPKSKGPKLFSISGDVKKPGVYEFPMGTSLRRLLAAAEAEEPQFVLVGGSGGRIACAEKCLERNLSFEDLPPGGSVIVLGKKRNLISALRSVMDFFVEESCGQCVPCREGCYRLLHFVEKMEKGEMVTRKELNRYLELGTTMQTSSKCGLGQSASNVFVSMLDYFEEKMVKIQN